MFKNPDSKTIQKVLNDSVSIAVVGVSSDRDKPSYRVAKYLLESGYNIIPVNPALEEVLGEKCYPSLEDIPYSVDLVDIFRKAEAVPELVDSAIDLKIPVIWIQEGIHSPQAAEKAQQAGLQVIMDLCIMKEHRKLC
ncbi:MAG TPA: CoA-binding protein [Bacillota bacterium]|nr:CoA-binding protein [Bacillota bacterium]